jgi:RNA polymerase sigma-70 factor (ECF subfamily)
MTDESGAALAESFRQEWPRLVAAAARIVNDLGRAEEIAQDVMVTALDRWPFTGVPDRPGAWLLTATRNRARNAVRDDARARARDQAAALPERLLAPADDPDTSGPGEESDAIGDDRLRLVFACCHPALSRHAQVALTLRLVGGLSTSQIARAFLVSERTMAQRMVRAKRSLAEAGVPFAIPERHEWGERIPAVLAVVYLIFNEGYQAASGPTLSRPVLCDEAQRLAGLLTEFLPCEPEVHGLAALIALHRSRLATRVDADGDLIPLEDQDRRRWDQAAIAAGRTAIEQALALGPPGPLTLQAMIVACHADAPSWDATDWEAVLALYDQLHAANATAVVSLNRAVALSMARSPEAGLAEVDRLTAGQLARYHPVWATRAYLLARVGRDDEAAAAYRRAAAMAGNEAERRYLLRRAGAPGGAG